MPPVGFEPTISAAERPQTYALDRAATGTGICLIIAFLILSLVQIRTERRQNSIYGEFSFATVFASKDHVSAAHIIVLLTIA